jgi:hypothetical protein
LQDTEGRMVLGGENGARTGKAASTTVGVTALQAPRDAEQRDLWGPTVICSTVMNNACNDVNVVVAMDPDTVLWMFALIKLGNLWSKKMAGD